MQPQSNLNALCQIWFNIKFLLLEIYFSTRSVIKLQLNFLSIPVEEPAG